MKTLFVSIAALLFAIFVGCQESSITDPVVNTTEVNPVVEMQSVAYKDAINFYPGVIKLEGTLLDPSQTFNGYTEISGIVRYRLDQNDFDSGIKVSLYIKAELKGVGLGHNQPLTISNTSEDMVSTSNVNQAAYFLEKSFEVNGTWRVPLNLVLKFQVTEKEITLVSMSLKKSRSLVPVEDLQK